MENDFKGRKCAGCRCCVHANRKKMKCYPNSKNCKKEYALAHSRAERVAERQWRSLSNDRSRA